MGKFGKSRLRKGISIVAAMILLLNSIMPTVPVFANETAEAEATVVEAENGGGNETAPAEEPAVVETPAPAEEPAPAEVTAPAEQPAAQPAEEPAVEQAEQSPIAMAFESAANLTEATADLEPAKTPVDEIKSEPAEETKVEAPAEEPKVEAPAEEPKANTTPMDVVAESVAEAVESIAEEKNITWEWTSEISKVKVTVTAPKSSIEEGTEPVIRDLTDEEIEQYREYFIEAGVSEEDMVTFDITFYDADKNEITDPIEGVEVSFDYSANKELSEDGVELEIIHIDDEIGLETKDIKEDSNQTLVIETDSFSPFIIIKKSPSDPTEVACVATDSAECTGHGTYYSTLQAAINAVSDGAVIELQSDMPTSPATITNKKITLNLGNYKISGSSTAFSVGAGGELIINATSEEGGIKNTAGGVISISDGGKVTINNGKFEGTSTVIGVVGSTSVLTVNGGFITGGETGNKAAVHVRRGATANIHGGNFIGKLGEPLANDNLKSMKAVYAGGEWNYCERAGKSCTPSSQEDIATCPAMQGGTINIDGGYFAGRLSLSNGGKYNITAGTFKLSEMAGIDCDYVNCSTEGKDNGVCRYGTMSDILPVGYTVEVTGNAGELKVVEAQSDTCTEDKEACIGTVGYNTLVAAVTAVATNATVLLNKDITLTSSITINKKFTLNLGTYKITGAVRAFNVGAGGDLTIDATSEEGGIKNTAGGVIDISNGGKVTINNGKFEGTSTVIGVKGDSSVLTINNGFITGGETGNKAAVHVRMGATANIHGGSFIGKLGEPLANDNLKSMKAVYAGGEFNYCERKTHPCTSQDDFVNCPTMQGGTINIDGGYFAGRLSLSNGGKYNITAGTFKLSEMAGIACDYVSCSTEGKNNGVCRYGTMSDILPAGYIASATSEGEYIVSALSLPAEMPASVPANQNVAIQSSTTVVPDGETTSIDVSTLKLETIEKTQTEGDGATVISTDPIEDFAANQDETPLVQGQVEIGFKDGVTSLGPVTFNQSILVRVPVKDNISKVIVKIKHGNEQYGYDGLYTSYIADCSNPGVTQYDGGLRDVQTDAQGRYVNIYTCKASTVASFEDAYAEVNGVWYDSLASAISAATDGQTVKLLKDTSEDITINVPNLTLDLNNKTITGNVTVTSKVVTIKDGTITVASGDAVDIEGTNAEAVLNNVNVNGVRALNAYSGGKLTVNGGIITSVEGTCWVGIGGTAKINGGTFSSTNNCVIMTPGNSGRGGNTVTINGGIFNGSMTPAGRTEGYTACGIYVANDDTVKVNGGTFNIDNGVGVVIRAGKVDISENAVFNVTGDPATVGKVGDALVTLPAGSKAVVDLKAGYPGLDDNFNVKTDENSSDSVVNQLVIIDNLSTPTSYYSSPSAKDVEVVRISGATKAGINGGSFSEPVSVNDCAAGKIPTQHADGSFGVTAGYKVRFYDEDGTTELKDIAYVPWNQKAAKPSDPIKAGYTFAGWFKDGEVSAYDFDKNVTKDINLKAHWLINVTFDSNEGSEVAMQTVANGGTAIQPAAPTRDGYNFIKWQKAGVDYEFATPVTAPITLTAVWEPAAGAVTYKVNHVKPDNSTESVTYYGTAGNEVPTASLADREYVGYIQSQACTTTATIAGNGSTVVKCTYVSEPAKTATFNNNGAQYYQETVQYNGIAIKPVTDPTYASTEKTYTFVGWATQTEDCANHLYNFSTLVKANLTLHACYNEGTTNSYTVTFVDEDDTVLQSEVLAYGAVIVAPANPQKADSEGTSYTFAGWTTDGTTVIDPHPTVGGDVTYRAKYTPHTGQCNVKVGSKCFPTIEDALLGNATIDGSTIEVVVSGDTPLPSTIDKAVTIKGMVDGVVFNHSMTTSHAISTVSKNVTFENVKFNLEGTAANYDHAFRHTNNAKITMKDCVIEGMMATLGDMVFDNCEFINHTDSYNIHIQKGNISFNGGSITSDNGTLVNVFNFDTGDTQRYILNFYGTKFVNNGATNKSAINIKEARGLSETTGNHTILKYTVNIETVSAQGNFPTDKYGRSKYWMLDYIISELNPDGTVKTYAYKTPKADKDTIPFGSPTGGDIVVNVGDKEVYSTPRAEYTITFKDGENQLQSNEVLFGDIPTYNGEEPTKTDPNDEFTYEFAGWKVSETEYAKDTDLPAVNGETVYAAYFTSTPKACVAKIGTKCYATLAGAVNATNTNDTVVLQENITIDKDGVINVDKKITIDMNGKTINYVPGEGVTKATYVQPITIEETGDLTITGGGTINGPINGSNFDGKVIISVDGGKLTIENGIITATGENGDGMYGVYVLKGGTAVFGKSDGSEGPSITSYFAAIGTNNTTAPANITVYGGTYEATANPSNNEWWSYFCAPIYAAAAGDFDVQGGTFSGYYGISSRYSNVDQDITIGNPTFNASSTTEIFVDSKSGSEGTTDRNIVSTSNPSAILTIPEGYVWVQQADSTYKVTKQYTITWKNGESPLGQDIFLEGETPVYTGDIPTKPATAKTGYTFTGWTVDGTVVYPKDGDLPAVTGAVTYKAVYDETVNKYTITFVNSTGTELQSSEVEYDVVPTYNGATPTSGGNDQYRYEFSDWNTPIVAVAGAATYTAVYNEIVNNYTISFVNDDDSPLWSSGFDYNAVPAYDGATPTKADSAGVKYTFTGWKLGDDVYYNGTALPTVTGAVTYKAAYEEGDCIAKIGDTCHPSLVAAIAAANSGDIVKLMSDVNIGATQVIAENLTIDLNGHDITATNARALWIKNGDVTITGSGTISANKIGESSFADTSSVIRVGDSVSNANKAKLTIGEDVTVSSDYCYGITVFGLNNTDGDITTSDIEIEINGKVIVSGSQAAVSGNGTNTYSATTMTIGANAEITSVNDYAIYHPGKGTLTVNGTVTGKGGIEAKAGTVTISDSAKVEATATAQDHVTNNDGTSSAGYAIAAISNASYVGEPVIKINGGNVTGKIEATGDNNVEETNATFKISGGTFSQLVDVEYCDDGYIPSSNTAGFTVEHGWKVKYLDKDGTQLDLKAVRIGDTAKSITAPIEANLTFKEWQLSGSRYNFDATVTKDITLDAAYTAEVKFESNGGTPIASQTVAYSGTAIKPNPDPELSGHTFKHWYLDDEDTEFDFANIKLSGDITLTAKWNVVNYTISFVNDNNTPLWSSGFDYNTIPTFDRSEPTKVATDQTGYTFTGWTVDGTVVYPKNDPLPAVTGAVTYKAVYDETVNEYTITFNNYDGTELQSSDVAYDDTPVYAGATPTKNATTQTGYTFAGWYNGTETIASGTALSKVTGAQVYTAVYNENVNQYTVTIVSSDTNSGTVTTGSITVDYNTAISYTDNVVTIGGETSTANTGAQTDKYTFNFDSWDASDCGTTVTKACTITGNFSSTVRKYTVKFVNSNGTELQSDEVEYDVVPSKPASTPTSGEDAQYTYEFYGWNDGTTDYASGDTLPTVTGETTYTAIYTPIVRSYTVTWVNNDGNEIYHEDFNYGSGLTFAYSGKTEPQQVSDSESCDFIGWTGNTVSTPTLTTNLPSVAGAITYYANYSTVNCNKKQYTLTFVDRTGNVVEEQNYNVNTQSGKITPPAGPDRPSDEYNDYIFDKWTPEFTKVTGPAVYTATYTSTPREYVVEFVWNDANGVQSGSNVYYYNSGVTAPEGSTGSYSDFDYTYTFAGWSDGTAKYADGALPDVTTGVTYTAKYNHVIRKYTIAFVDYDLSVISSDNYAGDESVIVPSDPSRTGYIFTGWTASGSTEIITSIPDVTKDETYTANYDPITYTISFDGNGGTGTPDSMTETYDVTGYLNTDYARDGYDFVQWTGVVNGSDQTYLSGAEILNLTSVNLDTITLHAEWSAHVYTATFVSNSGTAVDDMTFTIESGDTNLPTSANISRTGYLFSGWFDNAELDGVAITTIPAGSTGDKTFYAKWTPITYTIRFNSGDATSGTMLDLTMTYDSGANLPLNVFEKDGHEFSGWLWGTTGFADGSEVNNLTTTNGDIIELVAQWSAENYTVTYHANNGTDASDTENVTYGISYTYTGGDIFSKEGYTFSGWNTQLDGNGDYKSGSETWSLTTGSDLYAIWTPITYSIKYVPGEGGTGEEFTQTLTYDVTGSLANNSGFNKTGYLFGGWEIGGINYSEGYAVINLTTTGGDTVIATAVWAGLSYPVTYYANNGTDDSVLETGWYNQNYTFTGEIFSKTGYQFSGWNTQNDGNGEYKSGSGLWKFLSGLNLYAIWTENSYVVEFTGGAGAEGSTGTLNVSYTEDFVLPDNDAFTKTGYTFSGWNFGGTSYATGTTLSGLVAENGGTGTFTAEWTANGYKVTYKANGGSGADVQEDVVYNNSYTYTGGNIFSKEGYTFSGWNTDENGSGDYKSGTEPWTLTSGLDLYAIWTQNQPSGGGSSGGGGGSSGGSSSGGGGGGGSSRTTTPTTGSALTGTNAEVNTGDNNDNIDNNEENNENNEGNVDSDGNTPVYDDELIAAYNWAHELGITTMPTIEEAMLFENITREQLAKMMVVYISKVLGKQPVRTDVPKYRDVSVKARGQELYDYTILAYQFQIMGIDANGKALEYFNPSGLVTRAEFATVLSRVLFGNANNQKGDNYREKHIQALEEAGILTNTDPAIQELRGWILLMLYRSQNSESDENVSNATVTDEVASDETAEESDENGDAGSEPILGIANPASEYCVAQGGEISIVTDAEGNQSGICKLTDGTEIEEWEYFRANNPETGTGSEEGTDTEKSE